MRFGELTILSKRSVELKEQIIEVTSLENDPDRLIEDRFLNSFDLETGNDIELDEPISNIPIHVLDIEVSGDYLTGAYKDEGVSTLPYEVKLWLVLEEEPEPIEE